MTACMRRASRIPWLLGRHALRPFFEEPPSPPGAGPARVGRTTIDGPRIRPMPTTGAWCSVCHGAQGENGELQRCC